MKILLGYRLDWRADKPVECYSRSVEKALRDLGHEVMCIGEGHSVESVGDVDWKSWDLFLEIDNGRGPNGTLGFQRPNNKLTIPSAVWFIDSHGQPTLHKRIAYHYDYVFFAVWRKRDLFARHKAAHWCPNATDLQWFGWHRFPGIQAKTEFGFFGSKGGLDRADPLVDICKKRGWSYDVRQVAKTHRHKWPHTGEAMAACKNLFNHGQKHDGPNQRVMESMAMGRPLLTDLDEEDGMSMIFEDGTHFIGYKADYSDLEEKMEWVINNPWEAKQIAHNAYAEVMTKHKVSNRVKLMLGTMK